MSGTDINHLNAGGYAYFIREIRETRTLNGFCNTPADSHLADRFRVRGTIRFRQRGV